MSSDELIRLKLFSNLTEARLAISVLEENGIVAQISDEAGTFDLGLDDSPETEVIVKRSDYDKAIGLVDQLEVSAEDVCPAWVCQCGEEVDEGFFTCWSCGTDYEPGNDAGESSEASSGDA